MFICSYFFIINFFCWGGGELNEYPHFIFILRDLFDFFYFFHLISEYVILFPFGIVRKNYVQTVATIRFTFKLLISKLNSVQILFTYFNFYFDL